MATYKNVCIKDQRNKNLPVFSNDEVVSNEVDKFVDPVGGDDSNSGDYGSPWKTMDAAAEWIETTEFKQDITYVAIIISSGETSSPEVQMTKQFIVNHPHVEVDIVGDGIYANSPKIICSDRFLITNGTLHTYDVVFDVSGSPVTEGLFYVEGGQLFLDYCLIDISSTGVTCIMSESGGGVNTDYCEITTASPFFADVKNIYMFIDNLTLTCNSVGRFYGSSYLYIKGADITGEGLILEYGSTGKISISLSGDGTGTGITVSRGSYLELNGCDVDDHNVCVMVLSSSNVYINGGTYSNAGSTCLLAERNSSIIATGHTFSGNSTDTDPVASDSDTPSYGNKGSWIYSDYSEPPS